jgi:hypothetical protein
VRFRAFQRGVSANDAQTGGALIEHLLWQTQNEGMATYVAYRIKPDSVENEDYQLLESPAEVRSRFRSLRRLVRDCKAANGAALSRLPETIRDAGNRERVYYVVGAYMAKVIEERRGRRALVKTVSDGPRAFFRAYTATSPPLDLSVDDGDSTDRVRDGR